MFWLRSGADYTEYTLIITHFSIRIRLSCEKEQIQQELLGFTSAYATVAWPTFPLRT